MPSSTSCRCVVALIASLSLLPAQAALGQVHKELVPSDQRAERWAARRMQWEQDVAEAEAKLAAAQQRVKDAEAGRYRSAAAKRDAVAQARTATAPLIARLAKLKNPRYPDIQVHEVGEAGVPVIKHFRVDRVLSDQEMVVTHAPLSDLPVTVLLKGFKTEGMYDDLEFWLDQPVAVTGTERRAGRTMLVVEPYDARFEDPPAAASKQK